MQHVKRPRLRASVTGLVDAWSKNGYASPEALALLAPNETDPSYWKMFASAETPYKPHITTTYNSFPGTPASLLVTPCDSCTSPISVPTRTPNLSAVASDPEGGTVTQNFEAWTNSTTSTRVATGSAAAVSGQRASWKVPDGLLQDDTQYKFRVRSFDGTDYSAGTDGQPSTSADLMSQGHRRF